MSELWWYFPAMILTQADFETAVEHATELYNELKADYPGLRLCPIFSRFGTGVGQCPVTINTATILTEFPSMLVVDKQTDHLSQKLRELKKAKKNKISDTTLLQDEIARLRRTLPKSLSVEGYAGDVNIELQCGTLIYKARRKLPQDPRLPPGLNTVGNIREITGLLKYLTRDISFT